MNRRILWLNLLLAVTLLAACGQTPEPSGVPTPAPTALPTAAPTTAPTTTPTAEPTTEPAAEDHPLYVAIIWHQHQPVYYKDPDSGVYAKAWVRVHAAEDYVDMAAVLEDYPDVHVTFNLTPSLIRQLDDLAAGTRDQYGLLTEVPANQLTDEDREFLRNHFFDINLKVIARFPRYQEIADDRENSDAWDAGTWRDLQVLFNLAWTDPDWLAQEPLKALVDRGRGFSRAPAPRRGDPPHPPAPPGVRPDRGDHDALRPPHPAPPLRYLPGPRCPAHGRPPAPLQLPH